MVSTANIYPLISYLLKESNEIDVPATTYFVRHCNDKVKLVKTEGQLFIQKNYHDEEFKVYFFHNNRSKSGAMPDESGEILSRYCHDYSWWMFSLNSSEENEPNCDGGWAYIDLLTGGSTITIKSQYIEEEDSLIKD
jgi:hypothetical protein